MTFSIPRVNVIESDEGFSVELQGHIGLRYQEGPRTFYVDSEVLMDPSSLMVSARSIKRWDPPHVHEAIDAATRARIVDNIRRPFRFRGYEIDVVE